MTAIRILPLIGVVACSATCSADKTSPGSGKTPTPSGVYVLNDPSNEQSTSTAYAAGLETSTRPSG